MCVCVPLPGVLEPGEAADRMDWGGAQPGAVGRGPAEGSCGIRGGMVTPALLLIKPLTP